MMNMYGRSPVFAAKCTEKEPRPRSEGMIEVLKHTLGAHAQPTHHTADQYITSIFICMRLSHDSTPPLPPALTPQLDFRALAQGKVTFCEARRLMQVARLDVAVIVAYVAA